MSANYICVTCGIQFATSEAPPESCPICEDERQYINPTGQTWTTLADLRGQHHNFFTTEEPNLIGIHTTPAVAIGQRALLVQTPVGNVLWDCTPLLDETTVTAVQAFGGIAAIAVSHPHLCSNLVEWSHAFDHAPIYWHADDKEWVMRPDPAFVFWEGERQTIVDGVDVVRCGGHFPGSSVLHWQAGAQGKGALMVGDTMILVADGNVSFIYSAPNRIPLPASAVRHIAKTVDSLAYDRIYGGWESAVIANEAKTVVQRSADRYLRIIEG
ncbi:MAG: MBL fold metallo-hydrolase [Chloroflexota bacterium]